MATQNCPGILQVEMRYQADGQNIYNVFHARKSDLSHWTATEIDAVENEFRTGYWTTSQQPLLCGDVALHEIVCTDLTDLSGLKKSYPISPAEAGTHTGASLPNSATVAVKAAIGTRGRGSSGRIFWPPMPEGVVVANTVDNTYSGLVTTALNDLKTAIDALIFATDLVVLSRRHARAVRPLGIGEHIYDWVLTDTTIDSQKNRLPRHRRNRRQP
jgi:hypothetical protein